MLVNWEMGGAAPPIWVGPRPKIFWLVNPTHGWVKPPKFRPNRRDGPSPCVSLTCGHSVKRIKSDFLISDFNPKNLLDQMIFFPSIFNPTTFWHMFANFCTTLRNRFTQPISILENSTHELS